MIPTPAENKHAAIERMKIFDRLPKEWRDYANEHGLKRALDKSGIDLVERDGIVASIRRFCAGTRL